MGFNFPNSPALNDTYAPAGGPTFTWDGTAWKGLSQGSPVTVYVSDTAPTSPAIGQLWWNSATGTMAIWYADADSAQWVQVSGQAEALVPIKLVQAGVLTGTVVKIFLTSAINAGYRSFQLRWNGMKPSADNAILGLQVSTDGGTVFQGTGYAGQGLHAVGSAATTASAAAAPTTYVQLANAANILGLSAGVCDFWSSPAVFEHVTRSRSVTTVQTVLQVAGQASYSNVNAVQLFLSGGASFAVGDYAVYGYRTT
jgi:hypothetical protein